jgi:hypothetical protein
MNPGPMGEIGELEFCAEMLRRGIECVRHSDPRHVGVDFEVGPFNARVRVQVKAGRLRNDHRARCYKLKNGTTREYSYEMRAYKFAKCAVKDTAPYDVLALWLDDDRCWHFMEASQVTKAKHGQVALYLPLKGPVNNFEVLENAIKAVTKASSTEPANPTNLEPCHER